MKKLNNKIETSCPYTKVKYLSSIYFSPYEEVKTSQFIQERLFLKEMTYQSMNRRKIKTNHSFAVSYDLLTKLPTERFSRELLEKSLELAKKNGDILAILILTINDFKQVNDIYSQNISNKVLVEIALRLRKLIPNGRQLARMGRSDFLVNKLIKKGEAKAIDKLKKKIFYK